MKALSIRQPWASLIIKGAPVFKSVDNGNGSTRVEFAGVVFKDIENRWWATKFRGRIYVHASRKADDFIETMKWLGEHIGLAPFACMLLASSRYSPRGFIIGEVDLIDCVSGSKSPWFVGTFGFCLANPKVYEVPIPCKGKLGFFEPDISLSFKRVEAEK